MMTDFFEILDSKGVRYAKTEDRVVVQGDLSLYSSSIKQLPDNLVVGGYLDLQGTKVTTLPKNLVVQGWLDMKGTKVTVLPESLVVGGGIEARYSSVLSLPDNLTVGGYFDLAGNPVVSLPDNLTVGGNFYIRSTKINSLPDDLTIGGRLVANDLPISHSDISYLENQNTNFLSWQDGKYIKVDGLFTEVVQRKGNVWRVKRLGRDKVFYLVTDGNGRYAHGDTLDKARESLLFKLSKHSVEDYKSLTLESVLTFVEAVSCYRTITGACEFGVRQFVKDNNLKKQDYTVQQMLELTTDAYGGSTFSKFFNHGKNVNSCSHNVNSHHRTFVDDYVQH